VRDQIDVDMSNFEIILISGCVNRSIPRAVCETGLRSDSGPLTRYFCISSQPVSKRVGEQVEVDEDE